MKKGERGGAHAARGACGGQANTSWQDGQLSLSWAAAVGIGPWLKWTHRGGMMPHPRIYSVEEANRVLPRVIALTEATMNEIARSQT